MFTESKKKPRDQGPGHGIALQAHQANTPLSTRGHGTWGSVSVGRPRPPSRPPNLRLSGIALLSSSKLADNNIIAHRMRVGVHVCVCQISLVFSSPTRGEWAAVFPPPLECGVKMLRTKPRFAPLFPFFPGTSRDVSGNAASSAHNISGTKEIGAAQMAGVRALRRMGPFDWGQGRDVLERPYAAGVDPPPTPTKVTIVGKRKLQEKNFVGPFLVHTLLGPRRPPPPPPPQGCTVPILMFSGTIIFAVVFVLFYFSVFSFYFCRFFAKGMQLKINTFSVSLFCGKTTPCARNELCSQIINIGTAPEERGYAPPSGVG